MANFSIVRNYSIFYVICFQLSLFLENGECNQCSCTCNRASDAGLGGLLGSFGAGIGSVLGNLDNGNANSDTKESASNTVESGNPKGENRGLGAPPPDPDPSAPTEPGVPEGEDNVTKCPWGYTQANGEAYYGTLDQDYGCHLGYCWTHCALHKLAWCYSTKTYSQSFSYVTCEHSAQCCYAWKCAGACGF